MQRLRPHLEELYKKIAYDNLQRSAAEHQGPSEDAIEDMVRRHREEIGERFHEALQSRDRVDEKWEPEPGNKVFLAAPKPVTTISAINDWSAAPNPPCSLRSLSQKVIMDGLRQSLVGAKAKAAFCCGGSVAFRKTGLDGWEGLQPAVAPVTIHWDSKQSGARKIVFSHESSRDPQFAEDLEQLCRASEPASFGRGGETVRDGKYLFFESRAGATALSILQNKDVNGFSEYSLMILRFLPAGHKTRRGRLCYKFPSV